MKKRTIVFGSMLAVFLMLMIPNVSAVEYNTVKETLEANFYNNIEANANKIANTLSLNVVESVKKILTVFLFIIETLCSFVYWLTPSFLKVIDPSFLNSLMDSNPILGVIFGFLTVFGLPLIMIQPLKFIQNLIDKIGAWDQNLLSNIHILILLGPGAIIYLLEYLEIIDLYSWIPPEMVQ